MTKRFFNLCFMLTAATVSMWAADIGTVFEYDGINYKIGEDNTVAVTRTKDITGVILIPSQVAYDGVFYTVTSIEAGAFDKNHDDRSVTKVAIPSTMKSIGAEAFFDLYGLTGVYITDLEAWCNISFSGFGSNPLQYAQHLFLNNEEVKDLVIPDGMTSIGKFAFYNCSGLHTLTIPNSVTSIGSRAFGGCDGIKDIFSHIKSPFEILDDTFEGVYTATLRVPLGTRSAYQSTAGWSNFLDIFEENYSGEPVGLEINATNFPDVNFRSIVASESIDADQNGYLSDAELQAVTILNVSRKDIEDLKGIEYFTEMFYLICSLNDLKSLDVSKNTALTGMDCSINRLTSLDLSNNPLMTELFCQYNNLTALDVSNNQLMKEICCQGNRMEGAAMDKFVASLPETAGKLTVCQDGISQDNVINVEQLKVAIDKGWKVMKYSGDDLVEMTPDGILSLYNSDDASDVWYNLNGQRVENPSKGVYIRNGKKVIVGKGIYSKHL